jgi:hypothetical protein
LVTGVSKELFALENLKTVHETALCLEKEGQNLTDGARFKVRMQSTFQALAAADRAHLLDDVFSLAEAGRVRYNLAMDMTRYLTSETEYVPWKVASTKFNKLETLLASSPSYTKLRVRK